MPSSVVQNPRNRSSIGTRKVRKGTFSCWECKHRKRRCDLSRDSATACTWCRQKGLKCIGQGHDEVDRSEITDVQQRLDGVEAIVASLVRQKYGCRQLANSGDRVAATRLPPSPESLLSTTEARRIRCRELGEYVYSVLPPLDMIQTIMRCGKSAFQPHLGMPDDWPVFCREQICEPPYLLLAARKLFQLTLCLRQMHATKHKALGFGLDGSLNEIADRFGEAATHVTRYDFLVQSVEGLQTLTMEAYCRIYLGDAMGMRPIFHRALTYGQLLGIDQASETSKEDLWFRLVYAERFLSLGLGQHAFVTDDGFASDRLLATSNITRRLERIHVLIAGRTVARNIRMRERETESGSCTGSEDDFKETQDLDRKLKQATKSVPLGWWAPPSVSLVNDDALMDEVGHILTQMHHYYLLILIHQPYIVDCPRKTTPLSSLTTSYSKTVAMNASREVLDRFSFFKHLEYEPASFVGIGQKAIAASITLLLLHIEGHRLESFMNTFEHQRPQDLCLIEDNLDKIEEIFSSAITESGYGNIGDLKMLVDIEADAAYGSAYATWIEHLDSTNNEGQIENGSLALRLPTPYLGHICIARMDS